MDIQNGNVVPADTQGQAPKKSTNLILVILVIILLLGNAVVLYFLFKKPASQPDSNIVTKNENIGNLNEDLNMSTTSYDFIPSVPPAGVVQITANWNEWPVKDYGFWNDPAKIYDIVRAEIASKKYISSYEKAESFMADFMFYRIGTINSGQYNGKFLYIVTLPSEGPGGPINLRVINNDGEYVVLSRQSSESYDEVHKKIFKFDPNLFIANLETPDSIKVPNSRINLVKSNVEPRLKFLTDYDNPKKLFKFDGDKYVYRDNYLNCFIVAASDGTVREYFYNLDFAPLDIESIDRFGFTPQVIKFSWLNGEANKIEYTYKSLGGCVGRGCYNIPEYIKSVDQLKEVGKNAVGESFYELKDIDTKEDSNAKNSVLRDIYDSYYPGYDETGKVAITKLSFDNFLKEHPLLYWQGPLGEFIAFQNAKYLPAAECGKPVIYLYPTKTTDVSVKVNPTGGFTKTEPVYGNGWRVLAEPNGNLYNYQDKKNYPYLFWEGYALNYQISNQGFVVAKNEVNKFLREKLAIQGLNAKEINDFVEFWLPRMQSDPYYFVTFVPQTEFDKMAPLAVSPRPDSIIRVFMDYKALDKPIQVKEQKLSTPKRTGFTVVEWGGELQK